MPTEENLHEDDTIYKVALALREADLTEDQINDAINTMQDYGILFRERPNNPTLF